MVKHLSLGDSVIQEKNGNGSKNEEKIILTEEEKNTKLAYVILLLASGLKDNQVEEDARENAVKQWVEAINNVGGFGSEYGYWTYIRKNPSDDLQALIESTGKELLTLIENE